MARHLFHLVLNLKIECMRHQVYLHECHISGDHMIVIGINGWSRGDCEIGVSEGFDLRHFLLLDKGAFDVAGHELGDWMRGWMGEDFCPPFKPESWFDHRHRDGVNIRVPPLAAALIALK
jgi:hypothetical protein